MQEENKGDKIGRVLQLYAKLSDGTTTKDDSTK